MSTPNTPLGDRTPDRETLVQQELLLGLRTIESPLYMAILMSHDEATKARVQDRLRVIVNLDTTISEPAKWKQIADILWGTVGPSPLVP